MVEPFKYDCDEVLEMIGTRVLRVWDHEHLDSVLPDYVRCEAYQRSAFEQHEFRAIWTHREPTWDWDGKQPSPKDNPQYHLVHEVSSRCIRDYYSMR